VDQEGPQRAPDAGLLRERHSHRAAIPRPLTGFSIKGSWRHVP